MKHHTQTHTHQSVSMSFVVEELLNCLISGNPIKYTQQTEREVLSENVSFMETRSFAQTHKLSKLSHCYFIIISFEFPMHILFHEQKFAYLLQGFWWCFFAENLCVACWQGKLFMLYNFAFGNSSSPFTHNIFAKN